MTWKCGSDMAILFITKILRMFSFGAISVIFLDVLLNKGILEKQIGFLQSFVAVGDIVISLLLTTKADKLGRKKTLVVGALLKILAGVTYAMSNNFLILLISGALGVLTVSGGEIGPFLPLEQASIAQLIEDETEDKSKLKEDVALVYGYYNMASYISQAAGNLCAGLYLSSLLKNYGGNVEQYKIHIFYLYALFGIFKALLYLSLSNKIEPPQRKQESSNAINWSGLTKESTKIIFMLSSLFIIDSFAGGFVAQSFISFYYQKKYDFSLESIGGILFVCNIVGGISGVLSSKLVAKIGAMATMIVTHLPSNILLVFISITENRNAAVLLIMGRFCISQMDVPARQTYVSMVVSSEERSAANGITNIVRSVGVALAFPIAGILWEADEESFLFSLPFLIAGTLKIIYDLTLGVCFLWSRSQTKKEEANFQELQEGESVTEKEIENVK